MVVNDTTTPKNITIKRSKDGDEIEVPPGCVIYNADKNGIEVSDKYGTKVTENYIEKGPVRTDNYELKFGKKGAAVYSSNDVLYVRKKHADNNNSSSTNSNGEFNSESNMLESSANDSSTFLDNCWLSGYPTMVQANSDTNGLADNNNIIEPTTFAKRYNYKCSRYC